MNYPDHEPYDDDYDTNVDRHDQDYPVEDDHQQEETTYSTYTSHDEDNDVSTPRAEGEDFGNDHTRAYTSDRRVASTPQYDWSQTNEAQHRGYIPSDDKRHEYSLENRQGRQANRKQDDESNWPDFLVSKGNQLFFSIAGLVATLTFGAGIIFPIYYLFILDDSEHKYKASKVINWVAFIVPVVLACIVAITMFVAGLMGATVDVPQLPYPYGKIN